MKNNLVLLCLFLFSKLYSAEIEMQSNSRVKYDEFIFTNKSKYIIINHEGQWTDSIGNYGSNECKGLIKKNENDLVYFLDVICELVDQNNQVTWRKFERTGSQIERGVGVSTIIDTTSKYKDELIGTKCTYAVNRTKDMVFVSQFVKYRMNYLKINRISQF